jgi:gamma-glutamylputrescine oxidase
VPLHGERETLRATHAERFDDAVWRAGFHDQPLGQPLDALVVERVHSNAIGIGEAAQYAALFQHNVVGGAILDIERLRFIVSMVEEAGDFVQLLVERAAEGDIHLLEAAAYAQHRDSAIDGLGDERERGRVPVLVVQCAGSACGAGVMQRLHVGWATREKETIDDFEQLIDGDELAQRGDQERYRVGRFHDRTEVLLSDRVKRVMTDHSPIGRQSNDGTFARHDSNGASNIFNRRRFRFFRLGWVLHHSSLAESCRQPGQGMARAGRMKAEPGHSQGPLPRFAGWGAGPVSCAAGRAGPLKDPKHPAGIIPATVTEPPHISSYYASTAHPSPVRPALAGAVDCDVCVVGGGIAGCSAALHLAERGYRVVLLEGNRIGWGASGRSGAQALFGVAAGHTKMERLVGERDARVVWDITVEGLALIRELIARHRIDCDWRDGHMQVAMKPRHDAEIREEIELLHSKLQYPSIRYMTRDEVRAVIPSERYISGLYDPNCGHLHPLNYTLGLAAAAERAGAQIFESSRALSWTNGQHSNAPAVVRTAQGEVRAKHVVLCGNVYLRDAAPALWSKIMAVATYIVATEPLGEQRAAELVKNNACVIDSNWVVDYFRRSADHRLLFGGRVNYSGIKQFDAPAATRLRMLGVYPQLSDVKIEFSWGGEVDITLNRAPHFGRLAPNVYFLQGFSGHGLVLTGIAGKLVAEAISGTAERFDVFSRIPHLPFPGGMAMRRPALVLAMLYYRLRDML